MPNSIKKIAAASGRPEGKSTILFIDDDANIRKVYSDLLSGDGYKVIEAVSAADGLEKCKKYGPDIVILDCILPDKNAGEILEELNEICSSVIVFSGALDEHELLELVKRGAVDFIKKPAGPEELLVRINARLRDRQKLSKPKVMSKDKILYFDKGICINVSNRSVIIDGSETELSETEFKILLILLHNNGQVVDNEVLLNRVWQDSNNSNYNNLKAVISRLRKKTENKGPGKITIKSKYNAGYILSIDD